MTSVCWECLVQEFLRIFDNYKKWNLLKSRILEIIKYKLHLELYSAIDFLYKSY